MKHILAQLAHPRMFMATQDFSWPSRLICEFFWSPMPVPHSYCPSLTLSLTHTVPHAYCPSLILSLIYVILDAEHC